MQNDFRIYAFNVEDKMTIGTLLGQLEVVNRDIKRIGNSVKWIIPLLISAQLGIKPNEVLFNSCLKLFLFSVFIINLEI